MSSDGRPTSACVSPQRTSSPPPPPQPSRIPVRSKTPTKLPQPVVDQVTATAHTNGVIAVDEDELWVFGYGSLVWKVDFPVTESQTGYIKGYRRRFYQQSIDHRGTPEKPGLVVTLIPVEASTCPSAQTATGAAANESREVRVYGVAHRIADDERAAVIEHLDHREKNGYDRHTVDFYPWPTLSTLTGRPHAYRSRKICLYLASAENASYAGPLQMATIAEQVLTAHGPSGPNVEYVYRLADAMREMFPGERDEHLFELERTLRGLELELVGSEQ